jgi:hypothetical protein
MIRFGNVVVMGSGEEQKVHGLIFGPHLDGRYSFTNVGRHDAYFKENPNQPLLGFLADTDGSLTQQGVDSGDEDIAPHIYIPEAANRIDTYAILPGVELQFINSWSSQDRPRGYHIVETGPGVLREYGRLLVHDLPPSPTN